MELNELPPPSAIEDDEEMQDILEQIDEMNVTGMLGEFEQGIIYAIDSILTFDKSLINSTCKMLLEEILCSYPAEEEPEDSCEIIVPPPKIVKEEDMSKHHTKRPITINGNLIRDKEFPSGHELGVWYANKKGFHSPLWANATYTQKVTIFQEQEAEHFTSKELAVIPPAIVVKADEDYTDEQMLEMLHTKEDDIGLVSSV